MKSPLSQISPPFFLLTSLSSQSPHRSPPPPPTICYMRGRCRKISLLRTKFHAVLRCDADIRPLRFSRSVDPATHNSSDHGVSIFFCAFLHFRDNRKQMVLHRAHVGHETIQTRLSVNWADKHSFVPIHFLQRISVRENPKLVSLMPSSSKAPIRRWRRIIPLRCAPASVTPKCSG